MLNIVTQVPLWENEKDLEVKNFRKKKVKNALTFQALMALKKKRM